MRRWMAALAATVTLTVATGCGNPAGVDGMLTDDWPELPAAVGFAPEANVCHEYAGWVRRKAIDYRPVACTEKHLAETIQVGSFPAAVTEYPDGGTKPLRDAYAECDKASRGWLGGDWREAALTLNVVPPSQNAWRGGARWFRCDLGRRNSIEDNGPRSGTASLKDAMTNGSEPRYGCYDFDEDGNKATLVPCDRPHTAEFAGTFETNLSWEKLTADGGDEATHRNCLKVIAKFAKVPDDGNVKYRSGSISYYPSLDEWTMGSRTVRCLLWLADSTNRSVRGGGTSALPIG
ncbi:septum formation family protein [Polymorphospora sp. NPDC051019]|uniref:septum formation family protein n=1 Tax=Polymorphospora sp. NPDC051019 TaxID=3155725 RepID=UPI00342C7BDF